MNKIEPLLHAEYPPRVKGCCGSTWLTWWLVVSILHALIGSFCFGYNIPLFNVPQATIRSHASEYDHINDYMWGAVNAMFPFGALFGALFSGRFADKYGRKKMIAVIDIIQIFSSACVATSHFYAQLIFGRFVTGIASGAVTVICTTYLNEISPSEYRGRIGSLFQAMLTLAIVTSTALGILYQSDPEWRYGTCVPGVLSLIQLCLYFTILPSPGWLETKNREFEANVVKAKLWINVPNENDNDDSFDYENEDFGKKTIQYAKASMGAYPHSFKYALFCSLFLHMFQQLSGINGVFYYSETILEGNHLKYAWLSPWLGSVYIAFANFLSANLIIFFVDKWGRIPLLLVSAIGMGISCILITLSFYFNFVIGIIICLMLFVVTFELGLGPIPFFYVAELCPIENRAKMMSYALATNWCFNTVIALTTSWIMSALGTYGFVPFGAVLFSGSIVVWKFFPETKYVAKENRNTFIEFSHDQSY